MTSLVTCDTVGEALVSWLAAASTAEKLALCTALDCGPDVDDILAALKSCSGASLSSGTAVVTCAELSGLIDTLLANFFTGGTAGDVWMVQPDGSYGWGNPNVAPDDVAIQYVSTSSGSDTNAGTLAAPLKTIAAALANIPAGNAGSFYILLKAGENFPYADVQRINGNLVISYYGDATYPQLADDGIYMPSTASTLNRPTITIGTATVNGAAHNATISVNGTIDIIGIKIATEAYSATPTPGASSVFDSGSAVWARGCVITHNSRRNAFAGSVVSISGSNATRANVNTGALCANAKGITFLKGSKFPANTSPSNSRPGYAATIANGLTGFDIPSTVSGAFGVTETQSLFGMVCDYNPFA